MRPDDFRSSCFSPSSLCPLWSFKSKYFFSTSKQLSRRTQTLNFTVKSSDVKFLYRFVCSNTTVFAGVALLQLYAHLITYVYKGTRWTSIALKGKDQGNALRDWELRLMKVSKCLHYLWQWGDDITCLSKKLELLINLICIYSIWSVNSHKQLGAPLNFLPWNGNTNHWHSLASIYFCTMWKSLSRHMKLAWIVLSIVKVMTAVSC